MPKNTDTICNWQRLGPNVTTSGRLVKEDISKLAEAGISHVINLAPDGEGPDAKKNGSLPGEAGMLAAHGIAYTYIPVPFMAPEEAHFEAFRQAFEAGQEPVHIHCIANWRVSAFCYRYHRDVLGMDEAEARALMEQQWSPESSEYAQVWAPFIAPRP